MTGCVGLSGGRTAGIKGFSISTVSVKKEQQSLWILKETPINCNIDGYSNQPNSETHDFSSPLYSGSMCVS